MTPEKTVDKDQIKSYLAQLILERDPENYAEIDVLTTMSRRELFDICEILKIEPTTPESIDEREIRDALIREDGTQRTSRKGAPQKDHTTLPKDHHLLRGKRSRRRKRSRR